MRTDRKYERQAQAIIRNEIWRALTPREQLESLNKRRGNSLKQRTKILAKIEKDN